MLLTDLLTAERIRIPLVARTKDDLLRELVDHAADGAEVRDRQEVLRAVMDREEVLSTGIGHGVAIPHGKGSRRPESTSRRSTASR